MPLPKPRKGQSQDDFINACMGSEVMKKDYPDNKQRLAVCFSQFRRKSKKAKGANWKEVEENLKAGFDLD